MGVLQDNIGKYLSAIKQYQNFLVICKSIGDIHGEALAYNCIGVDYQLIAEEDSKYFHKAIEFHNKHEEIADVNGKFLACINLGLCYDKINEEK